MRSVAAQEVDTTAFANTDGSVAVVAANRHDTALRYALCIDDACQVIELMPRSIATFVVAGDRR